MRKLIDFFMNCTIEQLVVAVIFGCFVIRWAWEVLTEKN